MKSLDHTTPTCGIETEYSAMFVLPGDVVNEIVGDCHSLDSQLELYQEPVKKGSDGFTSDQLDEALESQDIYRNNSQMLSNGGRLYIDPSGPEYATPETTTAADAVLRSFEGDRILLDACAWLRNEGILEGFQLNRRVVDHNRTSRGIHLNNGTSVEFPGSNTEIVASLAALNIAKAALFGSGGLLLNEDGITEYHHSPRLSVTNEIYADYSRYTRRALVRGPFKQEGEQSFRVESITSDALNFGWPLRASLVTTQALLRYYEVLGSGSLPQIEPNEAIKSAISCGHFGSEGVMTIQKGEGRLRPTSLDVLERIGETILDADARFHFLDDESDQVLGEVLEVAQIVRKDPLAAASYVESIARKIAMDRKIEKANVGLDSERLCRFDYAWDWIGGGIAETLRDKGIGWHGFKQIPTIRQTKSRMKTPPADTRALPRGNFIASQRGADDSEWNSIGYYGHQKPLEPLQTSIDYVYTANDSEDDSMDLGVSYDIWPS